MKDEKVLARIITILSWKQCHANTLTNYYTPDMLRELSQSIKVEYCIT